MTSRNLLDESRGRSPRRAQEEPFEPRETTIIEPTSVPDLLAWYEAKEITGLSDGDEVTSWSDLSGNGNTLTQFTQDGAGVNRPTYRVTDGHINVLMPGSVNSRGLGTSHNFTTGNYAGFTEFFVGSATEATEPIMGPGDRLGAYGQLLAIRGSRWVALPNGGTNANGSLIRINERVVITVLGSNASFFRIYENGALKTSIDFPGNLNWAGFGDMAFFDIVPGRQRIEALLYYTRRLSQAEIGGVNSYLASTFVVPLGKTFAQ